MAHILIVEARFYEHIADALYDGVEKVLKETDHSHERVSVPGALEIPAAVKIAHETGKYDAYIALGCVIRGETTHYETVCQESARGLTDLSVRYGLALGNGILTVENEAQAIERARFDRKDKGGDAAHAALSMLALKESL